MQLVQSAWSPSLLALEASHKSHADCGEGLSSLHRNAIDRAAQQSLFALVAVALLPIQTGEAGVFLILCAGRETPESFGQEMLSRLPELLPDCGRCGHAARKFEYFQLRLAAAWHKLREGSDRA